MSMTDPIADLLTRIRNAVRAGHDSVEIPGSELKARVVGILKSQGYIKGYDVEPGPTGQTRIKVDLKPPQDGKLVLSGLKRISKPGLRVYVDKDSVPKVLNGMGIAILTTSRGVVTDDEARNLGVGGEVLCEIW
ncbi:MAG: 30S ribosomal protein S8 [Nitrospinae bacterium]|nr:30S ribosomal protein S8 [Nitrospinota bacterium]